MDNFMVVVIIARLVVLFLVVALYIDDVQALRAQAVERGYAMHCPHDGHWSWIGECGE